MTRERYEANKMDVMNLAIQERADLLALLRTLSPEQLDQASILPGWSVKDIAAHVVSFEALSLPSAVFRILRARLANKNPNDLAVQRMRRLSITDLIALYEDHSTPHGLTAAFGARIALTDGLIHHQDIRRSLKLPRTVPSERLLPVLEFALRSPTIPARQNTKELRLVAADVNWTYGQGPEVRGDGEPLLLAMSGRADALDSLDGPGVPVLSARLDARDR